MKMMKTNFNCKRCGKKTVEITHCGDSLMECYCSNCEEEWTTEPDGFGDGGLIWAEAMAFFEGDEE